MKTYKFYEVNASETGTNFATFNTLKEAENYINTEEEQDKNNGYFNEDYYAIKELEFQGLNELFVITISADSYYKAKVKRLSTILLETTMHNYLGIITDRGGSMDFEKAMQLLRSDYFDLDIEDNQTSLSSCNTGDGCSYAVVSIESLINDGYFAVLKLI